MRRASVPGRGTASERPVSGEDFGCFRAGKKHGGGSILLGGAHRPPKHLACYLRFKVKKAIESKALFPRG